MLNYHSQPNAPHPSIPSPAISLGRFPHESLRAFPRQAGMLSLVFTETLCSATWAAGDVRVMLLKRKCIDTKQQDEETQKTRDGAPLWIIGSWIVNDSVVVSLAWWVNYALVSLVIHWTSEMSESTLRILHFVCKKVVNKPTVDLSCCVTLLVQANRHFLCFRYPKI